VKKGIAQGPLREGARGSGLRSLNKKRLESRRLTKVKVTIYSLRVHRSISTGLLRFAFKGGVPEIGGRRGGPLVEHVMSGEGHLLELRDKPSGDGGDMSRLWSGKS